MSGERVVRVHAAQAGPVSDLPWLRRKLAVRLVRRSLRQHPVEGLVGVSDDGKPIWMPGYPDAHQRR